MTKPQFYECDICGAYHWAGWNGDCRQDDARLDPNELDRKYGMDGWQEVSMDSLPDHADEWPNNNTDMSLLP